jgi:hypothetical protein
VPVHHNRILAEFMRSFGYDLELGHGKRAEGFSWDTADTRNNCTKKIIKAGGVPFEVDLKV